MRGYSFTLLLAALVGMLALAANARAQITSSLTITRNENGKLGDETSHCPSLSGDGRFVVFESDASNLVPDDTNGRTDLFLYDTQSKSMRLISKSSNGTQQTGGGVITTCNAAISRDGSTVVYVSESIGLVDGLQTHVSRLYAIDVASGAIELLTRPDLDNDGALTPSINEDGTKIVFISNSTNINAHASGLFQTYLLERPSNTVTLLSADSQGGASNGNSARGVISSDGNWVLYDSTAANISGAPLPAATSHFQAYLLDLQSGVQKLVSADAGGLPGDGSSLVGSISADGGSAVFFSEANNLVPNDADKRGDVLRFRRALGTLDLVSIGTDGRPLKGYHELLGNAISSDGGLVMFRTFTGSFETFHTTVHVRDIANEETYLATFSKGCGHAHETHSGALAPDAPVLTFAVGADSSKSPLQLHLVNLDVVKHVAAAPQTVDAADVDVCGDTADLVFSPFDAVVNMAAGSAHTREAAGVTYDAIIHHDTGSSSTIEHRRNAKRNQLSLTNLAPGNYSVSYRVNVHSGGEPPTHSAFSRQTHFKIAQPGS